MGHSNILTHQIRQIITNSSVQISLNSATEDDNGDYHCDADFTGTTVSSNAATVLVYGMYSNIFSTGSHLISFHCKRNIPVNRKNGKNHHYFIYF